MIELRENLDCASLEDIQDLKVYYEELCKVYYNSENARVVTILEAELKNVYEVIAKGLANFYNKELYDINLDDALINIHKMCADEKKGDE